MHLAQESTRRIRAVCVTAIVSLLVFWPTDLLLMQGDPVKQALTARLRLGVIILVALMLAMFRWLPAARREPAWASLPLLSTIVFWVASCAGELGGLDAPWYYLMLFIALLPMLVPAAFAPRLANHIGLAVATNAGYFGLHPQHLESAWAPDVLVFSIALMPSAAIFGHVLHLSHPREFFAQRRAARANEALGKLNGDLESRVAEQTAELRMLGAQANTAREQERRRISRDLHDELGQSIAASRYVVADAHYGIAHADPERMRRALADVDQLLVGASATVRRVVEGLQPPLIPELGLIGACEVLCEEVARRSGLELVFDGRGAAVPPEATSLVVYRVLQEALTNVMRHARATIVTVALVVDADAVTLSVSDDGCGIATRGATRGFGLLGMRERAHAVGGRVHVGPRPGGGTEVTLAIPLAVGHVS